MSGEFDVIDEHISELENLMELKQGDKDKIKLRLSYKLCIKSYLLKQRGQKDEATEYYNRALEIDPKAQMYLQEVRGLALALRYTG